MRRAQQATILAATVVMAASLAGCVTPRYATDIPGAPGDVGPVARAYPPPPAATSQSDDDAPVARPSPLAPVHETALSTTLRGRADKAVRNMTATPTAGLSRPPVLATPRQVTVRDGDTLALLAERWRTPIPALIEANRLQAPYDLTPGSTLIVPPPLVYEVRDGDTLFGVARRFAMDPRSLANLNDIPLETTIGQGRRLALPVLVRDGGANAQASGAPPVGLSEAQRLASAPAPRLREELEAPSPARSYARPPRASTGSHLTPKTTADAQAAVAAAAVRESSAQHAPATDTQVSQAGRGRFMWPLRGQMLSGFGAKGPGQRNDGVDLAATSGEPVKAAAGGQVVYAGGAIPAFGNLVLVKHAGGWVTAYAHLGKIEVAMRQSVTQGQELGQAGQTGSVDQPQLHFEVRYAPDPSESAKPVDPTLVMPH